MNPRSARELNAAPRPVYLDIGAGGVSKQPGYISIDIAGGAGVDLVGDARAILGQLDTGSVDGIYSRHFLEHIDDVPGLVQEMVRVCRPGARIEIIVPHFSNPFHYSDVTHRRVFGLYSFCYMARSEVGFRRSIPTYARIPGLVLESTFLKFRSYSPRYIRKFIKKSFGLVFNCSTYMKELYEEFFCWLVPCYEIRYLLRVQKDEVAVAVPATR